MSKAKMIVQFDKWHSMLDEKPMDGDLCLLYGDDKSMYTGGWVERSNHFYLNCGWGGGLIIGTESVAFWAKLDDCIIKEESNESKP